MYAHARIAGKGFHTLLTPCFFLAIYILAFVSCSVENRLILSVGHPSAIHSDSTLFGYSHAPHCFTPLSPFRYIVILLFYHFSNLVISYIYYICIYIRQHFCLCIKHVKCRFAVGDETLRYIIYSYRYMYGMLHYNSHF